MFDNMVLNIFNINGWLKLMNIFTDSMSFVCVRNRSSPYTPMNKWHFHLCATKQMEHLFQGSAKIGFEHTFAICRYHCIAMQTNLLTFLFWVYHFFVLVCFECTFVETTIYPYAAAYPVSVFDNFHLIRSIMYDYYYVKSTLKSYRTELEFYGANTICVENGSWAGI